MRNAFSSEYIRGFRAAIRYLIRAGVNIKIVQTLMRHENISLTLDTYGHILDTDSEKAISDVYK